MAGLSIGLDSVRIEINPATETDQPLRAVDAEHLLVLRPQRPRKKSDDGHRERLVAALIVNRRGVKELCFGLERLGPIHRVLHFHTVQEVHGLVVLVQGHRHFPEHRPDHHVIVGCLR